MPVNDKTLNVTQADRNAAAAYMKRVGSKRWSIEGILDGGCDNTSVTLAFAAHRLATIAECVEVAEQTIDRFDDDCCQDLAADMLIAIRTLAEQEKNDA